MKFFCYVSVFALAIAAILSACAPISQGGESAQVERIMARLAAQKKALSQGEKAPCADKKCAFVTVWDFDGTILHGDSSEGLRQNGQRVYRGFMEYGIVNGLSRRYSGENGFARAWRTYKEMEHDNRLKAYVFLPQIFAGTKYATLTKASRKRADILRKYFFTNSERIIHELKEHGVKIFVVSASAEFIVRGVLHGTGIPTKHIHGIELAVHNGVLTRRLVKPVTYAEGKAQKLREIVSALRQDYDRVYILAGFGNSYHTDGPFLKYIVEQQWPTGKPFSVMINGGDPPEEYQGLFDKVTFSDID